jgi:hypothetical protein
MKLGILANDTSDCPFVDLTDFVPKEAGRLVQMLSKLITSDSPPVQVHQLDFVEAIDGCHLNLEVSAFDQGLIREPGTSHFVCRMTPGTWDNIAGLIEPFCSQEIGYQWLVESPETGGLLLSPGGEW